MTFNSEESKLDTHTSYTNKPWGEFIAYAEGGRQV